MWRLDSQLEPYRALVNLLAQNRIIQDFLIEKDARAKIENLLARQALTYGAVGITLLDAEGKTIASYSPNGAANRNWVSDSFATSRVSELGQARAHRNGQRLFIFRRGIALSNGHYVGAVLLFVAAADLEYQWAFAPEVMGFLDENDMVFMSNRPSLLLNTPGVIQDSDTTALKSTLHDDTALLIEHRFSHGSHQIWSFLSAPDLPKRALMIEQTAPKLGLKAVGFLDVAPARAAAAKNVDLALALTTLLFLAFLLLLSWRSRTAERLVYENKAKIELQEKVRERTDELLETQAQLLQATKMTVLGQMSAGISHEVNQPLATILALAENGDTLLDIGKPDEAQKNLKNIGIQADRIRRIVRGLREFAQAEDMSMDTVDVVSCLDGVLHLIRAEAKKANFALHVKHPDHPLLVRGGIVRLQQVLINIAANAIDAMSDQPSGELNICIEVEQGMVSLKISDTGPGIAEPERVFDPFYTTKELGKSKGLGLGLSISYGIINSFGGSLSAENHACVGAMFRILLPLIQSERDLKVETPPRWP